MNGRRMVFALGIMVAPFCAGQTSAVTHAPDGGVRERLVSIDVPAIPNAPFTAVVTTEWTHMLPDGSTATIKNHRTIARDSSGRVFEERRFFSPTGDKTPTLLSALEYRDPNRYEFYHCQPQQKMCTVSQYFAPTAVQQVAPIVPRDTASSRPNVKTEPLGERRIETLEVTGSREITTLPAQMIGSAQPEPAVKEFWYSPRLGVNLIVKRFDPRTGVQNFVVDHISLSEPDPQMFMPPTDYRIVQLTASVGMQGWVSR